MVKQLKSTHTGVFHVLKEPAHGDLGSVVASRQQGLLTADSGEAHRFELGDRVGVDFGSRGCRSAVIPELCSFEILREL